MSQREEVQLLIQAGTEGLQSIGKLVKELDTLGQDTSEASGEMETLGSRLNELRGQQQLISQFRELKRQTTQLAEEQRQAQERATELGKALSQTEKPTRAQRNEFNKARRTAKEAEQAWQSNQQQLNQLRESLQQNGVSTRDLAGEQQRIKREISGVEGEVSNLNGRLTTMRDRLRDGSKGAGGFRQRLSKMVPTLSTVRKGINAAGRAVTGLTAAAGASIATMTVFNRRQAQAATEINNTSEALDVSAETVQTWRLAFDRMGLSGDKATDVIRDMADRLGEFASTGGGEAADTFKQLNLQAEDFQGLSADQQFLKLASAVDQVNSKAQQVNLLERIAEDASMIQPLLENNAAKLREIQAEANQTGEIYTDEQLQRLQRADRIYNRVEGQLSGIANRVSAAVAPALAKAADNLSELFNQEEGDRFVEMFRNMATSVRDFTKDMVDNSDQVASGFDKVINTLQFLGNSARAIFRGVQAIIGSFTAGIWGAVADVMRGVERLSAGLNAVGLVGDEAYSKIAARADAARKTNEEATKQAKEYGKKALQAGKDAFGAFSDAGDAAEESGDKAEEAGNKFQSIKDEIPNTFEPLTDAVNETGEALSATGDEAEKAGQDTVESFRESQQEIENLITSVGEAGKTINNAFGANTTASVDAFREHVSDALGEFSNTSQVNRFEQQLVDAANNGNISSQQLQQALKQVRERIDELNGSEPDKPGQDIATSADDATESTKNLKNETKDAGEQAEKTAQKFRKAWGAAFGKVLTQARTRVSDLSIAARNLFEQKIGGNQFVQQTQSATEALGQARRRTDELVKAGQNLRGNSFSAWMNDTATASAEVAERYWEQRVQLERLTEEVRAGQYSYQGLADLSDQAKKRMDLLNESDLDSLQSAIDGARSRMESLRDESQSTLQSLQDELLRLQGREDELAERRRERQREEIRGELQQAQAIGDEQSVSNLQKALNTLDRIAQEEKEQRQAEREEQRRQERERQRQQREQRQPQTGTQPAQAPAPSRTVRVELNGAQADIPEDQADQFLSELERAGMRSQ